MSKCKLFWLYIVCSNSNLVVENNHNHYSFWVLVVVFVHLKTLAVAKVTLKVPLFTHLVVGTGSCLEPWLGLPTRIATGGLSPWLGLPHSMTSGLQGQVFQDSPVEEVS